MAFVPIVNGASLCFHFVTNGQNWQFCLNVQKSGSAPTTTDLTNIAGIGHSWWTATAKALMNIHSTLVECVATDQTSQGAPQAIDTVNEAGTFNNNAVPIGTPLVVSLRTAKRGRSYRGRLYWSGLNINSVVGPTDYDTTATANIGTAVSTLLANLTASNYIPIVASRQHNGALTSPAHAEPIVATIVDTHFDSQRRRLFGRGK